MNVPPLEPVPDDHVLTKSFYLLKDFPGRYRGSPLWVEQALDTVSRVDRPVRTGDGVSPILITGNDFVAAWALDENGMPLYPTEPDDAEQRIMALRSGVNIMMYMLTGNYKSDQVHIPSLLERLGQMIFSLAFDRSCPGLPLARRTGTCSGRKYFTLAEKSAALSCARRAAAALVAGLANPVLQAEDRAPLKSTVAVVVDKSQSQAFGERSAETALAVEGLKERLAVSANLTCGWFPQARKPKMARKLPRAL